MPPGPDHIFMKRKVPLKLVGTAIEVNRIQMPRKGQVLPQRIQKNQQLKLLSLKDNHIIMLPIARFRMDDISTGLTVNHTMLRLQASLVVQAPLNKHPVLRAPKP